MFDKEFFHKMNFTQEQIQMFLNSAKQSLKIAKQSTFNEVKFKFAYEALIKAGIALFASKGYKIRSKMGHHIKILETMSKIIKDDDIEIVGNIMRNKRNNDLYTGGVVVSQKECIEYLDFVDKVFRKIEKLL